MTTDSLYDSTKKRLTSYGVFGGDVVERVAKFAACQSGFATYQEFFASVGVGEVFLHTTKGGGVPVVDVPARTNVEKGVLVIHAPMEMPLNSAQLYVIATIAGLYPEYRVIGFGSPSGDRFYYKSQDLTFWKRAGLLVGFSQKALVAPELDYLKSQGIAKTHQIGYSYGALKATLESQYLEPGLVESLVLIDPVVRSRSIFKLIRDFSKTYGPLGKYVNASDLKTYHEARGDAAKGRNHREALRRPISIVIGLLLARTNIFKRLQKVISMQPQARMTVVWGTASELGDDGYTQQYLSIMPVQQLRLEGAEHALANDVHLYGAIVGQGLSRHS